MALYGLKSSVDAFVALLVERMDKMGFKSSIADPDVWIRPTTKIDDEQYYEFILMYVDNMFEISQDLVSAIREFAESFRLKNTR